MYRLTEGSLLSAIRLEIGMSVKTEHRRESFHGTKVYVVNPEQLRQKVVLHSLQLGKSKQAEKLRDSSPPKDVVTHAVGDRKPRKRRLESDEGVFEDEDDVAYTKICSKEVTTRAGRVSKFRQTGLVPRNPKISSNVEGTALKVKKREPASVFRCPTCQKVYIGYSKLKLHFRKFPDHYNHNKNGQESTQDVQDKSTEVVHVEAQTDLQRKSADAGVQTIQTNDQSSDDSLVRNAPQIFSNFGSIVNGNGSAVAEFRNNLVPHAQATEFQRTCNSSFVTSQKITNVELHAPTENVSHACENIGHVCPTSRGSTSAEFSQSSKTDSSVTTTSANSGRTRWNSSGQSYLTNDGNPSLNGIFQKLIWDLVEEKMIQHGINEVGMIFRNVKLILSDLLY